MNTRKNKATMKNCTYLIIGLVLLACHSKPPAKTQAIPSGPFDLATLTLNENLPELMKAKGIKAEPKDSLDKTLLGYEVFKSSDPQLLRFKDTSLPGAYGKNKNHVLFHYSEAQNTLAGYELYLYDQAQTDTLSSTKRTKSFLTGGILIKPTVQTNFPLVYSPCNKQNLPR